MNWVARIALFFICPVMRHPPATALTWTPAQNRSVVTEINRARRDVEADGDELVVTTPCLCQRKWVDPIPPEWLWKALMRLEREGRS